MSTPSRLTSGVSTAHPSTTLGNFPFPDPSTHLVWFNHFVDYNESEWVVTRVDGGTDGADTRGVIDAHGGVLQILNNDADNDETFLQWCGNALVTATTPAKNSVAELFAIAGKKTFFKARFKVSDATDSDFVIGLQITDTSPLACADGVWFQKDDDDALLDFHVAKASAQSSLTGIATLANDTYVVVGFVYDGDETFSVYVNDVQVGTLTVAAPPTTEIALSFGLRNGAAAAKSMSIDYLLAAIEG
jgi:hypothetical protein